MFRFTIREVFLLVVIVALDIGWWVDHRRMSTELADAKKWWRAAGAAENMLNRLGWETKWDFRWDMLRATKGTDYHGRRISSHKPSEPIQTDD